MIRLGYDAATPPANPPHWSVCGVYLGPEGRTPHVWQIPEIARQPAPWLAPLWVADAAVTAADAAPDMQGAAARLAQLGAPHGITIWIDTEDWLLGDYLAACEQEATRWGYHAGNYGSLDAIVKNPVLSGGRWSAHWDGLKQLDQIPGVEATQFANASMLGTDYDGSIWVNHGARLWRRDTVGPPRSWADHALADITEAERGTHQAAAILRQHGAVTP